MSERLSDEEGMRWDELSKLMNDDTRPACNRCGFVICRCCGPFPPVRGPLDEWITNPLRPRDPPARDGEPAGATIRRMSAERKAWQFEAIAQRRIARELRAQVKALVALCEMTIDEMASAHEYDRANSPVFSPEETKERQRQLRLHLSHLST